MKLNPTNQRKALRPLKSIMKRNADIKILRIEDMTISPSGGSTLYFKRLKYKGCPKINNLLGDFYEGVDLIDMGRDDFVRDCYDKMVLNVTPTTRTYFYGLVNYLQWLDINHLTTSASDYLKWDLIDGYMEWCSRQVNLGELTNQSFSREKMSISWLLKQSGLSSEARRLPSIKRIKKDTKPYNPLDLEKELKPVAKLLFKAYRELLSHYQSGTLPIQHPIYDKQLVEREAEKLNLKGNALANHHASFKKALRGADPKNHIVRVSMMITFMFTGINLTPLSNMQISDVSFKEVQGGKYIFDSTKGRAKNQQQDNSFGFSKHAKEFIESWLSVAIDMAQGDPNALLFPYYKIDGEQVSYSDIGKKPQQPLNKLLQRMGLPNISSSIFRKTKSDTLFRVTESVYLVAMSNNNSMEVTARTYIHGTEKEHENNLAAAMSAKLAIVKGEKVTTAVDEAKFNHGDILDNYEYQRLRKNEDRTHEARTPTGARCNDNRKGAALIIDKSLKKAGIKSDKSEVVCTDFLSCFECQQHAFVTDVDDIWLMLSFRETLQQLQQTPSVNSMPEQKYTDLFNTVDSVLKGFEDKNENNYNLALEKLKDSPHPLYSTVYSLNDLLEIFG